MTLKDLQNLSELNIVSHNTIMNELNKMDLMYEPEPTDNNFKLEIQINPKSGITQLGIWGMREGKHISVVDIDISDMPDEFQSIYSKYLLLEGD